MVVSPEAEDYIFPALKPLKKTKATAPVLPLLQGASFSYCFPSEQLCGVVIITIINKCSLLI